MASTQSNTEGTLAHPQAAPAPAPPASSPPQPAPTEIPQGVPITLGQEQVMALLKHLPGVFSRVTQVPQQGDLKDNAAAEALSNLSQSAFGHPIGQIPMHTFQVHPGLGEPGPSTHPHGPPNLGQPSMPPATNIPASTSIIRADDSQASSQPVDGQASQAESTQPLSADSGEDKPSQKSAGGRRSGRSATMTNDEWARQRKDNHKEVERRRRGNINEGINELGRIVPNGSGEKAKGAILSRAVSYIHHLKENEARNIEKWTLEKLLMDQAMGDLQAQLEEMRRMWDEERTARQRAEAELAVFKGLQPPPAPAPVPDPAPAPVAAPLPVSTSVPATSVPPTVIPAAIPPTSQEAAPQAGPPKLSPKRTLEEMTSQDNPSTPELQYPVESEEEKAKRPRIE